MGNDVGNLSSTIIEQAKTYYKEISEKRLSRGSIRKGLIACCLFFACKKHNVPRSIKEISQICNIRVSTLNKTTKIFVELMGNETKNVNGFHEGINVENLISRFCNVFDFETKQHHCILRDVRKVHEYVTKHNILCDKTPTSLASGMIYYVLVMRGYAIDKKFISEKHKISIVTLNKMQTVLNNSDVNSIFT
jgi:transcription initiation factor TFIIB